MKFISDLIEQWSCPFPCTRFYKGCMIHSDQFSAAEADGTAFVSPQNRRTAIHSSEQQHSADPRRFDWREPGTEAAVAASIGSMTRGYFSNCTVTPRVDTLSHIYI